MSEKIIHFKNADSMFSLVYPDALNKITIVPLRKLLKLMLDERYAEHNEEAIRVTKELASETLQTIIDDIDKGVGILSKMTLKELASKKHKYEKILQFMEEKE